MTRSFEKYLKTRLVQFAKLLGVTDYRIRLSIETKKRGTEDYDNYGYVRIDEETRSAAIFLNKRVLKKEPAEIDGTIIHELLHIRYSELLSYVDTILQSHVKDTKARQVYEKQLEMLEHKIIIALVKTIKKDTNG